MDPYARDLERWIPRLISVWRKSRRRDDDGPPNSLTPHELREVASGIRTLSMGLTRERKLAGAKYMDDPKLLGAYLLFYWPVSYAQGRQAMGELQNRPRDVLDLGSGPGPLSFAALDAGATNVIAADRSAPALKLARELGLEADEIVNTREWDPSRTAAIPDGKFDLITMGHVLNELFGQGDAAIQKRAQLVESCIAKLKPGGTVLILEPALRDTSRGLLQVRDAIVERGYSVRFPCMFRGNCPALIKGSDWCHAERPWQMPRVVEELAKAASLHKESLKMSYLALAPKGEEWTPLPEGRLFRIVSEPLEGKGRQRYMGCGVEGRVGLAMQDKHRNEENEVFFELQRGDVIEVDHTEPKGDGFGLDDKTHVKRIARAGRGIPPPGSPTPTEKAKA